MGLECKKYSASSGEEEMAMNLSENLQLVPDK